MTAFRILSSLLLIFLFLSGKAQNTDDLKDFPGWKLKNLVQGYTTVKDYYSAIDVAKIYLNRYPGRPKMTLKLARLFLLSRNYQGSLENYQKLYESDFKNDPEVHFYMALSLKRTGKYAEARAMFIEFKNRFKFNKRTKEYYDLLDTELAGCEMASAFSPDPDLTLIHLNEAVNFPHMDFAPFPVNDSTLLFASLRENSATYDAEDPPHRQFYLAKKQGEGSYQQIQVPYPFNDSTAHCGNGVFSDDGTVFIFTKCKFRKEGKPVDCELYWSFKKDKNWNMPELIPGNVNVPGFSTSYPGFGKDSKNNIILYFSSNRPGGNGGMDLWYATFDQDRRRFKTPKNCGKVINTTHNEIAPFCFPDKKTFFFSSDGMIGFGGLDIFKTEGELKRWNTPKNVGLPINSEADDLQYILRKDGESGFLVSNRVGGAALENGTCCDDIYEFHHTAPITITLKGTVVENMEMAPGEIFKKPGTVGLYLDIDNKLVLVDKQTLSSPMNFSFPLELNTKYRIIAERPGFLKSSKVVSTFNLKRNDTIFITPEIKALSDAPIIIKNIYYPFDKDYLTPESKTNIDTTIFKILNDNPEIIVEIGAHTDALGSLDYNKDLSQRRAQSVVSYLISLGIDKHRLWAKGYGSSVPIAPNLKKDGSDNPEGRAKNRRTEFRIVGTIPGASELIYEE